MVSLINDGWLYLSNGTDTMKLACRDIDWDLLLEPDISHYEGGFSMGFDYYTNYIVVKASGILFSTMAKKDLCIKNLLTWQQSAPFTLKIQLNAAGTYEKLDGIYTTYKVLLPKGFSGIQKIARGEGTTYEIGKLTFEEAGRRNV